MKILHLIRGGDSGGAKTHLFTLLDELTKYIDCEVVCLIPGIFYREILEKDIKTVLFEQKNRFDLSVLKKIEKLIEEDEIDILHVHGAMANFIAQFLKKRIKIPIVTTMHSDYLLDFDTFFKKIVFTSLNAWSLRRIDYFIAVSDRFKDMLTERGFRPNSIYTVYNGMEFSNVPQTVADKKDFAKKYGIKQEENAIYIGIAARFDSVKGVDIFIDGAAKLYKENKNVRFVIAGDGDQREQLLALSKELGLEKVIYFIGFIDDIYSFFNFIDINCLTSLCESFPYSMLEGAAMKRPMVASDVGGISSLVIDGETGYLFNAGDSSDFAAKLKMLCENQQKRTQMGENIYKRATTVFSAQNFAKTHIGIYDNILKDFNDPKRYDFVISGYYGYSNSGDDALLLAMVTELKRQKNDVRIAVFSAKPEQTKKDYKVDAYNRFNPFRVYKCIKSSRVLLSGGGSLIQDETSSKSLWYYAAILKLAKRFGLKVMQIANGIGPVRKKRNRRLASKVINSCVDEITLREMRSLKELQNMDIHVNTTVTSDPAMILEGSDQSEVKRIFEDEGIACKHYACIAMRDWKYNPDDFEKKIALAADYIYEKYNLGIVFIPMQYPADIAISERIMACMKNPSAIVRKKISIENVIGIIRESKLVLSMRLHTLIYGVSMNVPVVAVKYDPKVDGFMEYLRQTRYVDVGGIDMTALKLYIDEALANGKNCETEELCGQMRLKARENIQIAMKLLS